MMIRCLTAVALLLVACADSRGEQVSDTPLARSVEQLRMSVGEWSVLTEFLAPDGSVARRVAGIYRFSTVVPDRVLAGESDLPELGQAAGILFYINEATETIEMVSVGADGRLWIMTGPLGGEVRYSQPFETSDGKTAQLRFTRSNVSSDAFESRMDYSEDGGATWMPGNHQVFSRLKRE